jgi:hypothetical protein
LKEQEQDEKRQKTGETKKSDAIQENIEEAKSKAEKLTEMKSEMVWLLKQVSEYEYLENFIYLNVKLMQFRIDPDVGN